MKNILLFVIFCIVSLTFNTGALWGEIICVDPSGGGDYTNLQNALDYAETNGADDVIQVVQGTYTGNFTYRSSQGRTIILEGGYVPSTACSEREDDPTNTVLDGNLSGNVLILSNNSGGDILVDGFTIRNGVASTNGGGIYAQSYSSSGTANNVTITNNIITNNSASSGGGVYARSTGQTSSGTITLIANLLAENTVDSRYGGVHARSSSASGNAGDVILTNNTIVGNIADSDNAGVYAESISSSGTAGDVILTSNIIKENTADYGMSGVQAESRTSEGTAGDVILTNNIIAENRATVYGGGAVVKSWFSSELGSAGTVILTNNTITGNKTDVRGSGLIISMYDNTIYCYNNIIWGNTADVESGDDIRFYGTGTAYGYNNDYSDMVGSWTSSGSNINLDPRLTGSYHLKSSSPCIDAGETNVPSPPGLPSTDFEGDDRTIDGNKDGTATVDIGADEYIPKGLISHLLILLL